MSQKAKLLTAYLAQQAGPFDWSGRNCAHFAMGFVTFVEGFDPLAEFTMADAPASTRRLIKRGGGLAALLTKHMGRSSISARYAQTGDVVLMPISDTDAEAFSIGLCCGECAAVLDADGQIQMVAMAPATHAWRVGR